MAGTSSASEKYASAMSGASAKYDKYPSAMSGTSSKSERYQSVMNTWYSDISGYWGEKRSKETTMRVLQAVVVLCLLVMLVGVLLFLFLRSDGGDGDESRSSERDRVTDIAVHTSTSTSIGTGTSTAIRSTVTRPSKPATTAAVSTSTAVRSTVTRASTPATTAAVSRTTSTATTTAATTTTVPPRQELICTVGPMATVARFYPADGLCQYLFYTHVAMIGSEVMPTESNTSYAAFEKVVMKYNVTEGGLSFDIGYVEPDAFARLPSQERLSVEKRAKRIYHFGSLNIQYDIGHMRGWLDTAERMLQALKRAQQGRRGSRTVVALGTFGYSNTHTWDIFKDLVKRATQQSFNADTVILISSYNSVRGNVSQNCRAVPPTALSTPRIYEHYPSLNRLGELVKRSFTYDNEYAVVGLSLEMGAMTYRITYPLTEVRGDEQYQRCTEAALVSTELGCHVEGTVNGSVIVDPETQTSISIMENRNDRIVLWEARSTITSKMQAVKQWPPRTRFAWLLFDVHLIDMNHKCAVSTQSNITREVRAHFPYTL